ncbi:MAG: hypothetical protein GXP29_00040 [Planctomycetes bacterium]|nr:hypothetical protein [Planctomycetota bacterium]
MPQELEQFVKQAAGKRVLLVGDLILDRYVYGDAERISPEAPVPVLRVVERGEAVGGSGNVAACLHALGVKPVVCGVIGKDSPGKRLRSLLTDAGAICDNIVEVDDRPTITKTRFVGLAQHRHRQQLMRVDEESTAPLDQKDSLAVSRMAVEAVQHVDAVCIEDYDKGVVTDELVQAVVVAASSAGKTVFVDPARLSDYARYQNATVLTPNRAELAMAVGQSSSDLSDIATDAEELRKRLNVQSIVVTLDREGAVVVENDRPWIHVPTRPRSVYDNTGAGDAVLAMLATAVVGGASMEDAVRLANIWRLKNSGAYRFLRKTSLRNCDSRTATETVSCDRSRSWSTNSRSGAIAVKRWCSQTGVLTFFMPAMLIIFRVAVKKVRFSWLG